MFDGLLFDLDGTLWDATPAISLSWNRVLSRHPEVSRAPITVPEVRSTMGMLLPDIARKLFPGQPEEVRAILSAEHNGEMHRLLSAEGGTLYPKLAETLEVLSRAARLFLVSNCGDGYLAAFYAAHGLKPYFTGDLTAGRTGRPKAENIAQVVRDYGLARPVYVGDTALDYQSARQAGVPFLHAAYGFGQVEGVPAAARFEDIPAALAAMSPP